MRTGFLKSEWMKVSSSIPEKNRTTQTGQRGSALQDTKGMALEFTGTRALAWL